MHISFQVRSWHVEWFLPVFYSEQHLKRGQISKFTKGHNSDNIEL